MKKKLFAALLASTLLLSGCVPGKGDDSSFSDNGDYSSFKDVTHIDFSNILDLKVSQSVAQSFAWSYQYDDYSFLDTEYIKVDFDVHDSFMSWPKQEGDDDAIALHFVTDILLETYPTQNYSFNAYISHKTHYLYFGKNTNEAYRSKDKIGDTYIDLLLDRNNRNNEYRLKVNGNLEVSPDLPKSGRYHEKTKLSFKIEIVTDVTFFAYLNNEMLSSVKDDGVLGGFAYYEFEMPSKDSTLTITSDRFFVNREYSFSELFYEVKTLNEENVKGIKIEEGYLGVNPQTSNPTISYSEDERDISYNLGILEEPLRKTDYDMEGGNYQIVTFILENGEYSIEINNGKIYWNDFSSYQYFRFDRTPTNTFGISYPKTA